MSATAQAPEPAPQPAPEHAPVGVDVQEILNRYATELSQVTQRALVAETALTQVQRELAQARDTIASFSSDKKQGEA